MAMKWCALAALVLALPVQAADWLDLGNGIDNTRNQAAETQISPENVGGLAVKWKTKLNGDVFSTPAVDADSVYVADTSGQLIRLNRETGEIIWQRPVRDYTGIYGDVARASPVIVGEVLVLGSQGSRTLDKDGARVFGIDKVSGDPLWQMTLDTHPIAIITQSAVAHNGTVFVGVSSWEEYKATVIPGYDCCSFRGSLAALDALTGELRWQTHVVPEAEGYSGNPVWGGMPAVDPERGLVFATTGNNYSAPKALRDCVQDARRDADAAAEAACLAAEPVNYVDAFVAFHIKTGEIAWGRPVLPYDPYTQACYPPTANPGNCQSPSGPDFDFAQGPSLFTISIDGVPRDVIGAGQKSGIYWTLDRDTGEVLWQTEVGPGSALGGMQFGSATDGERIYVAVANFGKKSWKLSGHGGDAGRRISHGFWSALDAATGEILWQTADPNNGATDMAAVSVANGVVYAGSLAPGRDADTMFALNAATGDILWRFASGGSVAGGAAVVDGTVYWSTGYRQWGGRSANTLYAFGIQ
jgi:polyvinyl alcohol dehydrogenase (cytochrome)